MPITQERMIRCAATASALISMTDQMQRYCQTQNLKEMTSRANSVCDHTADTNARDMIGELLASLTQLHYLFSDFQIPPEDRDNVTQERVHFQHSRKGNDAVASYLRYKRSAERQMAASVENIPQFFAIVNGDNVGSEASPHPQEAAPLESMRLTRPLKGPRLSRKQQDYIDGKIPTLDSPAAPATLSEPRQGRVTSPAGAAPQAPLDTMAEPAAPSATLAVSSPQAILAAPAYADKNVKSTSVPPTGELYAPLPEGSNIL